jgi:hypothetical protein
MEYLQLFTLLEIPFIGLIIRIEQPPLNPLNSSY